MTPGAKRGHLLRIIILSATAIIVSSGIVAAPRRHLPWAGLSLD
jgi:hypothetical protein